MMQPYHCTVCGTRMNDSGTGTLACPKCETGAVATLDSEKCVSLHFTVTYEEVIEKQEKIERRLRGEQKKDGRRTAYIDSYCEPEECWFCKHFKERPSGPANRRLIDLGDGVCTRGMPDFTEDHSLDAGLKMAEWNRQHKCNARGGCTYFERK